VFLKRRFRGASRAWFWVASVTRRSGYEVEPKGSIWGSRPVGYGGNLAIRPASMVKPAW
jgi:hypothetical protein